MSNTRVEEAKRLLDGFKNVARPALAEHLAPAIPVLDQAAKLLEVALERSARLCAGFVGEAQVGKSSVVNALVDRQVLPSGGIGPLTARATRVDYAEESRLEVEYHGLDAVRDLARKLHGHLRRKGMAPVVEEPGLPAAGTDDDEEVPDQAGEPPEDDQALTVRELRAEKYEHMFGQARKLLAGSEDAYDSVIPAVTEALLVRALFATASGRIDAEVVPFRKRIEAIRALAGGRRTLEATGLPAGAFDDQLYRHAAGWLAPMVGTLDVWLDSDLARSIAFVDLPGIGVVGDPAADEARKFVEAGADALVLVVRNSGLTESIAELLQKSGVITRLLLGGEPGHATIRILVAVTRVDDVMRDEYRRAMARARAGQGPVPNAEEIFTERSRQASARVREQLETTLLRAPELEDYVGEQRERQEAVVRQLCESIVVHSVSAPSYLDIALGIPSEYLRSKEVTGIPVLREHLLALARDVEQGRDRALDDAIHGLKTLLDENLRGLEGLWQEGGAARGAWKTFRDQLQAEAKSLGAEVSANRSALWKELGQEVPAHIETICMDSVQAGLNRLRRLRTHGATLHYKSLDAALRHDGVWDRKSLNYPRSLTETMKNAIASLWEPKVVQALREVMRKVAERDLAQVEALLEKARALDARVASDPHLEMQKRVLQQESRTCVAWTRERLAELVATIGKELDAAVAEPFRGACVSARRSGKNAGKGAKDRMLEVFDAGGQEAVVAAAKRASKVLRRNYDKLVEELRVGFLEEHHDPVASAFEALTDEERQRAVRSDAQKRGRVLEAVAGVRRHLELSPQSRA